jgi:hypothetical protein
MGALEYFDEQSDPNDAPVELVGKKAHELVHLADMSRGEAFDVPPFRVVPLESCQEFHKSNGVPEFDQGEQLPPAHHVPLPAVRHYTALANDHAADLAALARDIAGGQRCSVRSSVVAELPRNLSMAGVSHTIHGVAPNVDHVGAAASWSMAAMWRPYSRLYLSQFQPDASPPGLALMFCRYIDMAVVGTATAMGDDVYLEYGRLTQGKLGEMAGLRFSLAGRSNWQGYWRTERRGERLRSAVKALLGNTSAADPIEMEIGVDLDGNLVFFQYRRIDAIVDRVTADLAVRHSTGVVTGRLVSLLNRPRDLSVLADPDPKARSIVAVHQTDDSRWDGFAYLWALVRSGLLDNGRVLLCHEGPIHRQHLFTAMLEFPQIEYVAHMPLERVTTFEDGTEITVTSDGAEAVLQRT